MWTSFCTTIMPKLQFTMPKLQFCVAKIVAFRGTKSSHTKKTRVKVNPRIEVLTQPPIKHGCLIQPMIFVAWVFFSNIGVNPKIMVPPNHPLKNRVFHYFHHPFWGTRIFGSTPIYISSFWTSSGVLVPTRGQPFHLVALTVTIHGSYGRKALNIDFLPPKKKHMEI